MKTFLRKAETKIEGKLFSLVGLLSSHFQHKHVHYFSDRSLTFVMWLCPFTKKKKKKNIPTYTYKIIKTLANTL